MINRPSLTSRIPAAAVASKNNNNNTTIESNNNTTDLNSKKGKQKSQHFRGLFCLFRLFGIVLLAFGVVNGATFWFSPSNSSGLRSNMGNTVVEEKSLQLEKISVVLMNFGRPQNIQHSQLMPTLLESDLIGEVLLTHNNPKTAFEYQHPKVRNIPAVEEETKYGLSSRFWFCAHSAKYPWVIHVDDDMEFPVETLQQMVHEFARDPNRIVGIYGRLLHYFLMSGPIASGYNTFDYHGNVDVVLTKFMIMPQKVCHYFHEYEYLVKDFVDANSHPHWNGEDIFMSLVTNHVYKHGIVNSTATSATKKNTPHPNYAMRWLEIHDVRNKYLSSSGSAGALKAISGNVNAVKPWSLEWWETVLKGIYHVQYRGHIWHMATRLLEETVSKKKKR